MCNNFFEIFAKSVLKCVLAAGNFGEKSGPGAEFGVFGADFGLFARMIFVALLRGNGDLWDFCQDEARPPFPERPLRASAWLHRPISSCEASIPLSEYTVRQIAWLHLGENKCGGPTWLALGREWKREGLKVGTILSKIVPEVARTSARDLF